jgi:hypothetical protein
MKTSSLWLPLGLTLALSRAGLGQVIQTQPDWLIDPTPFKARVSEDKGRHELVLENGLARRVLQLAPNAATIDYRSLVTGEQLLRATGPEAVVTLNGRQHAIGGLEGQPVKNYLKSKWLADLRPITNSYQFAEWREEPVTARFPWKKRREWIARDLPWPAPGRHVVLRFTPPTEPPRALVGRTPVGERSAAKPNDAWKNPEIDVHYTIYDGIPLLEKWLVLRNTSGQPVRVNRTVVESLHVQENESATEPNINWELPSLYVETDYAYLSMNGKSANMRSVRWLPDPAYPTQVSYPMETPCLLECAPEFGPEADLAPGATLTSIRCFELLRDGTDRERRGLAQRRLYRTIAPWSQENPVMVHLISNSPQAIRQIVDQGAAVGVEMIILSFGSGLNMESRDPGYHANYREVADYARSKGIVIGAYSLLASRGAGAADDNCGGPGCRIRYGVMPCLGSKWGQEYLAQLQSFLTHTGFGVLEHDGSYPGDTCGRTNHPGHLGLGDSQWAQFKAIASFYQWCRANGIYLNVPDWYYLNGSTKCAMNYKETNWSLPRDDQEIIERQNVYDGTWEKTASMGWMFVPLTQYHGGGAAATIEPLSEHLDHYEARLADLFGAGVQACYRGPRIYDTDATRALVTKWIALYKQHREVLDADIIHLRRPDGRDWDGILHVNPQGQEKGLAFFYNPLPETITREIRVPLYYTGLSGSARVSVEGAVPAPVQLGRSETATLTVTIPAQKRTWLLFTAPDK